MIIKKADKSHIIQIAELWNEAFGDDKSDVLGYLEYLLQFFYICEENDLVKAMASVLSVKFRDKNGGYIYAVATRKSERGKGLSTELLSYIKSLDEYEFLVLVPQEKELFEFYAKRGFIPFSSVETKEIKVEEMNNRISFEEISTQEYVEARKRYFRDSLIEWDVKALDFAKKMYGGKFFEAKNKEYNSAFFGFKVGEKLVIKELLCKDGEILGAKIANSFGCKYVRVSYPEGLAEPFAMIYPDIFEKKYFAVALD